MAAKIASSSFSPSPVGVRAFVPKPPPILPCNAEEEDVGDKVKRSWKAKSNGYESWWARGEEGLGWWIGREKKIFKSFLKAELLGIRREHCDKLIT